MGARHEDLAAMLRGYLDGTITPDPEKPVTLLHVGGDTRETGETSADSREHTDTRTNAEQPRAKPRPTPQPTHTGGAHTATQPAERTRTTASAHTVAQPAHATVAQRAVIPSEVFAALRTLGLSTAADKDTCHKTYRTLLKQCHPDKQSGRSGQTDSNAEYAQRRTAELNEAWKTLEQYFS